MQQTEKYQFNLIEGSDDFSPDPLNANMEKAEAALAGQQASLNGLTEEMGSGGANARITWGSFTGAASYETLTLPFKPVVVFVAVRASGGHYGDVAVLLRDYGGVFTSDSQLPSVTWEGSSVTFGSTSGAFNLNGKEACYVALGVTE